MFTKSPKRVTAYLVILGAVGCLAFLVYNQITANIELRELGRSSFDRRVFDYVTQRLRVDPSEWDRLPLNVAVPLASRFPIDQLPSAGSGMNRLDDYSIVRGPDEALVYRGKPADAAALREIVTQSSSVIAGSTYDPTNGPGSAGWHFMRIPKAAGRTN